MGHMIRDLGMHFLAFESLIKELQGLKEGPLPVGLRRVYGAQLLHGNQALQAAQVLRQVANEESGRGF